jgi:vitamin B12 transporter
MRGVQRISLSHSRALRHSNSIDSLQTRPASSAAVRFVQRRKCVGRGLRLAWRPTLAFVAGYPVAGWAQSPKPEAAPAEVEIIVHGARRHPSRPLMEPGAAGSTIDRARLQTPGVTVADALREEPGVQVTQSGGAGAPSTVRLRGATAAQTPVYLGSIRLNDEVGGTADLSTVPTFFLERVEVYRGHAPRLSAEMGVGGAVILVPRRAQESEASLDGEVGSYGTRALNGQLSSVKDERRLLVAVEVQAADNSYEFTDSRGTLFVDDDGGSARLPNADSSQISIWSQATEQWGGAQFKLLFHRAEREQGAIKLALVPSERARAMFSRTLFALETEIQASEFSSLTMATRALLGSTTLDDPAQELGRMTPRVSSPGERVEEQLTYRITPHDDLWVSAQVVGSVERLRRIEREGSTDAVELSATRAQLRSSLSADWEIFDRTFVGGAFDVRSARTQAESEGETEITSTGRIHARYEADAWEVYANLGRYQRPTTLSELYGASVLVLGNPELRPEVGWGPEVGGRVQWPRPGHEPWAWADVSAFARFSHELITYVRTAQGYLHPWNAGAARTTGAELSGGVSPTVGLTLSGQISLLDPRDTSSDRRTENDILPFLSQVTASARLGYERSFDELRILDGFRTAFVVIHQSSRFADPAGLGVIPSQTFGDLEAGVAAFDGLSLTQVRISNLWNTQRFDVVGFPLPGRSFFINSKITW